MELEIDYELTNLKGLQRRIISHVMPKLVTLVETQVDLYLQDLSKHMGTISGVSDYSSGLLHWQALDEETLEDAPKYWYKTGKAKQSISVNLQVSDDTITVFAGIAEHAPGYQEALWNELGFTPRNGDTLVRRPLFFPLAAEHTDILQGRISENLASQTIVVEI